MARYYIGPRAPQSASRFPSTLGPAPFPSTRSETPRGASDGTVDLLVSLIMARPTRAPETFDAVDVAIQVGGLIFTAAVAWACGAMTMLLW